MLSGDQTESVHVNSSEYLVEDRSCRVAETGASDVSLDTSHQSTELTESATDAQAIVQDVKSSWFYAILADEVSDVSGWEQLGVALRYVKNGKPCEKLVKFIACESIRGEDIDTKRCRGQGYDGTVPAICPVL